MFLVIAKTYAGETVTQLHNEENLAKDTFDIFIMETSMVSVEMFRAYPMYSYTDGRSENEKELHSKSSSEQEEKLERSQD